MTKKSYWFVICLATLTAYFACTPQGHRADTDK